MEKAYTNTPTVENTKELIKMTIGMGMESILILMGEYSKECGKMASNTEKAHFICLQGK